MASPGAADAPPTFFARGRGYQLWVRPTELVVAPTTRTAIVRMQLAGAEPRPRLDGLEPQPGRVHDVRGRDPKSWRTNIPTYAQVYAYDVYPNIDLRYSGRGGAVEYDFLVHPGADPERIRLRLTGVERVAIDHEGDLLLQTPAGVIRQHKPFCYQPGEGKQEAIEGSYRMLGSSEVGFRLAAYDHTRVVVIDPVLTVSPISPAPVLVYSTYLGGSGNDQGYDVAVDAAGNTYVAGMTYSTDFPVTPGSAIDPTCGTDGQCNPEGLSSHEDAFVAKFDPTGALVYATYLGGEDRDDAWGVAVDRLGDVYVTGTTYSSDFPVTPGAFDATCGTDGACNDDNGPLPYGRYGDMFVTKLDRSGSALMYSTYIGGNSNDHPYDIAVDKRGAVSLTGETWSRDYPLMNAFQSAHGGEREDAIVTKLNPGGTGLIFSTYLGGSGGDLGYAVAVDRFGAIYTTGHTPSDDFPTTPGVFQTVFGGDWADLFVTKWSPDGTLIYSTYLGGSGIDWSSTNNIAVDAASRVYLTGQTQSPDFPVTPDALDRTCGTDGQCNRPPQSRYAEGDVFIAILDQAGSTLRYSTYLGGQATESGRGIAVDNTGLVYLTGNTSSPDFPVTPEAFDATCGTDGTCKSNGQYVLPDAFVSILSPAASRVLYATYLGGSQSDEGRSIALRQVGRKGTRQGSTVECLMTGQTGSPDFPTLHSFQALAGGLGDSYVAKITWTRSLTSVDAVPAQVTPSQIP